MPNLTIKTAWKYMEIAFYAGAGRMLISLRDNYNEDTLKEIKDLCEEALNKYRAY